MSALPSQVQQHFATPSELLLLRAALLEAPRPPSLQRVGSGTFGMEKHPGDCSGQYVDEPVKIYSRAIYMRLAFSVAAHIEPVILLVDEVLAVGDAEFQKKCMQRIEQVGKHGQTVLFVSHDIQAVLRLCSRALLIERGRWEQAGSVHEIAA